MRDKVVDSTLELLLQKIIAHGWCVDVAGKVTQSNSCIPCSTYCVHARIGSLSQTRESPLKFRVRIQAMSQTFGIQFDFQQEIRFFHFMHFVLVHNSVIVSVLVCVREESVHFIGWQQATETTSSVPIYISHGVLHHTTTKRFCIARRQQNTK